MPFTVNHRSSSYIHRDSSKVQQESDLRILPDRCNGESQNKNLQMQLQIAQSQRLLRISTVNQSYGLGGQDSAVWNLSVYEYTTNNKCISEFLYIN